MVVDSITKTYSEKEDIKRITEKLRGVKFEDLNKSGYYEMSLLKKGTDEKEVKEVYPKFEKINLINERRLRYGDLSYDLHYELEDGTFFIIAICTEKKLLINAFHARKDFKSFRKSLLKSYKRELF